MRAEPKANLPWYEQRVRWGEYRDELQATRPEGCWCLGQGGKDLAYTYHEVRGWRTYCECPEGQAFKAWVAAEDERLSLEQRARMIARAFDTVQIPQRFQDCTLDTYPVTPETSEAMEKIRWWVAGADPNDELSGDEFMEVLKEFKDGLFLYGPYGTGKTGLAVGILKQRIYAGPAGTFLFITVPTLLDRIRATYGSHADGSESEVLAAVKAADFLVLDDLGAERVTDWVAEKLFTIINERHDEQRTTVFTSNLDIDQLAKHVGERTTWRIVEMCVLVKVDGPNLRV